MVAAQRLGYDVDGTAEHSELEASQLELAGRWGKSDALGGRCRTSRSQCLRSIEPPKISKQHLPTFGLSRQNWDL